VKRRPRDIGTAAETAVVRVARAHGFRYADRYALHGAHDQGDVVLCEGVIVEVKGGEAARDASDAQIEAWLDQTEKERINARADVALLVVQRRGVGIARAQSWAAWWRLGWLARLAGQVESFAPGPHVAVRCTLADALTILRAAGYGRPLDDDRP
jgi:hypothetical protein